MRIIQCGNVQNKNENSGGDYNNNP